MALLHSYIILRVRWCVATGGEVREEGGIANIDAFYLQSLVVTIDCAGLN